MADDPAAALRATVREPGTVWCYSCADGLLTDLPDPHAPFRWLHLNLADQRSLRWIEREAALPPALHALIVSLDGTPRFVAERGGIGFVLQDFERGLETTGLGQIGALHVVLTEGLLLTGRRRPLHSADLLRERLAQGDGIADDTAALGFLLGTMVDSFAALVLDLTGQLLDAEADLMANDEAPDTRELISARRRSAQLHRLIGGLRTLLQRMEVEPAMPPRLRPIPRELLPRLAALDTDITAAQQQLRLLRDELDLQAAQRTNQNVYLLSVLTALMMPATLVTGFFGMNTGGLPFASGAHGTLMAFFVAILSAAGTYLLLRKMGLIR